MSYAPQIGDKGIILDDGKGGWIFVKASAPLIGQAGTLHETPGELPVFVKANTPVVGGAVTLVDVPGSLPVALVATSCNRIPSFPYTFIWDGVKNVAISGSSEAWYPPITGTSGQFTVEVIVGSHHNLCMNNPGCIYFSPLWTLNNLLTNGPGQYTVYFYTIGALNWVSPLYLCMT
jgi:hypothetical protein